MNINKAYLISITFPKSIIERDDGQNINSCVATHSKETRVAYRLRIIFRVFSPAYVNDPSAGVKREAETWKELCKVKWCQVYRTTGQPCSCPMCAGERYSRTDFKRETAMVIREQLEAE